MTEFLQDGDFALQATFMWAMAWRPAAREVRRMPERLLHQWRRQIALRRLAHGPTPRVVLMVCHGNICRSPYAVARLRALAPELGDTVRVVSGGFVGPGRQCPEEALEVAANRGVDLSNHRSQLIKPADVLAADLIVVMDRVQQWAIRAMYGRDVLMLGDLDPEAIETREILDPVEQPKEAFERCYSRIDRCLSALVRAVSGGAFRALRSAAAPSHRARVQT